MTLRKIFGQGLVLLAAVSTLAVLLLLAAGGSLLASPSRAWILERVGRHVGLTLRVDGLSLSMSPPLLTLNGVGVGTPDGVDLSVPRLALGLEPGPWLAGRAPLLELDRPVLMLPGPSSATPAGTVAPSVWPLLPMPLDQLLLTGGTVVIPASVTAPAWRLEEIVLGGRGLSPRGMDLDFSGVGRPGGAVQGRVVLADGAWRVTAVVQGASAAALSRLAGVATVEDGEVNARADLTLAADGALEAVLEGRASRVRSTSGWDATVQWQAVSREGSRLVIQANGMVRPPGLEVAPVTVAAELARSGGGWHLEGATASIRDWLRLEGRGAVTPALDVQVAVTVAEPGLLVGWLDRPLPVALTWGRARPWSGAFQVTGPPASPAWKGWLEGSLEEIVHAEGRARGVNLLLEGAGSLAGERLSVAYRTEAASLAMSGAVLSGVAAHGQGDFQAGAGTWTLAEASLRALRADLDGPLGPISWSGKASGDLNGALVAEGQLESLGGHFGIWVTQGQAEPLALRVRIADDRPWAVAALPPAWVGGGRPSGQARGWLALTREGAGWRGKVDLSLLKGGWSAPVAEKGALPGVLAEGVGGRLAGAFVLDGDGGRGFDGALSVESGEWLAGSLFGDLADERLRAELVLRQPPTGAWSLEGSLRSRTLPPVTVRLRPGAKPGLWGGRITFRGLELAPLFERHVRAWLEESDPGWKTARVQGVLRTDLRFDGLGAAGEGAGLALSGQVALDKGAVQGPGGRWRVAGVALDLPLEARQGGSGGGKARRPGTLHLSGVTVGKVALPDVRAHPIWRGEALSLVGGVDGGLYGGRFALKTVLVERPLSPERRMVLSLKLDGLDLAALTGAAGVAPVPGRVSADLPRIILKNGVLDTDGQAVVELFQGRVLLSGLQGRGLDSAMPLWQMDGRMEQVDLEAATRRLEVGVIQGTIAGEVKRLVLADGVPVSFAARFASVPGDAPQQISVKALETIQTLGTGTAGNAISRGVMSLFNSYRYSRIGFGCRLKNDIFHLNGIDKSGNELYGDGGASGEAAAGDRKEYLVVGSLMPPTVEVINFVPVIDWKEMIKRLEAVGLGGEIKTTFGATDEQGRKKR